MIITSLSPIEGPATGGTVVNVTGSGFVDTVTIYCQFGTSDNITLDTVTATVLSSTLLQCTSPALQSLDDPSTVSLQISVNGIDYTNLSTSITGFTYEPNVTVLSVFPSMGEWTGGSLTLVTGRNFLNTSQLACIFDNDTTSSLFVVPATFISDTSISCITPEHSLDTVLVRVTLNGEDYSDNSVNGAAPVLYTYVDVWSVSTITPTYGFASGGTLVTVTGSNFLNTSTLSCIFENATSNSSISVQATYVDANTLVCPTPAMAMAMAHSNDEDLVSAVSVDVTVNGQDVEANSTSLRLYNNNTFYYVNMSITSLSPIEGPATGGTVVNVTGSGFVNQSPSTVSSVQVTISHWTQSQRLYCHRRYCSVRHPHCSHWMILRRSVFRSVSTASTIPTCPPASPASLMSQTSQSLSVFPSMGEWTGGSLTLVTGRNFLNTSQLACIFDNDTTSSLFVVPATFISDTSISCITPEHSLDTVLVRVTLNGEDYSDNSVNGAAPVLYTYVDVWSVSTITPTYGFASGGTLVTVTGSNFLNTSTLSCIFENATSNGVVSPYKRHMSMRIHSSVRHRQWQWQWHTVMMKIW